MTANETLEMTLPFDGRTTARVALDETGRLLNLAPDGLAAQAGMKVGDRIVAVRKNEILSQTSNKKMVEAAFASAKSPVVVKVIRENFDTSETEHVGDIFADGKERRPSNPRAKIEPLAVAENHVFKTMVV